jgi:predicted acylesterase/phospholipase RssA/tetratricopeptide (TPR) repeat protein
MSNEADDANVAGGGPSDESASALRRVELILGDAGWPALPPDADLASRLELFKDRLKEVMKLAGLAGAEAGPQLLAKARGAGAAEAGRIIETGAEPDDEIVKAADLVIGLARRLGQLGDKGLAQKLTAKVKSVLVTEAREILIGTERTPGQTLRLAKNLDKLDEFTLGWKVLDKALLHPDFGRDAKQSEIIQRRALYTYKDVNQPLGARLNEALEFLETRANLPKPERLGSDEGTKDQETLGLAGAIYKRKWELDRQDRHMASALGYYLKGYEQKPWGDQGYTSINAAFALDLLAYLSPLDAQQRREGAQKIRREIVQLVPDMVKTDAWLADAWFYYSTVGEAYFGLGEFDKAYEWLVTKPAAEAVTPPDWEFETTARQLANLVRVQNGDDFSETRAWREFMKFLGESPLGKGGDASADAVARSFKGKVGLALSGGGFRASLFHLGVLARLAELDWLRRVEVISCVSGGSIIGAHYYLEVRRLLQETPDSEIVKQHYIDIVKRLETDFLVGVQANIRTRVLTDRQAVRRMLRKGYTRTNRLGELYEEELYSRVPAVEGEQVGADGKVRERYMHELIIRPKLADGGVWKDFSPRSHNWRREAKAPILILNAATLNTGHNWQFTATYMGESPATIHTEIDSVYRLRRKYYNEGPHSDANPQKVRLGEAVAASSCVPILFEPIVLEGMYEGDINVKLVDGGVCDNQGVSGLLEQDCTVLLVSDGSGQIESADSPSAEAVGVAARSNGILQARIRGTQYSELDTRLNASMVSGLMFVHLKKDLDNQPVNWRDCPPESKLIEPQSNNAPLTKYGISKAVQAKLAAIRTDLDSFCDQEAYALMTSAYRMTEFEHRKQFDPNSPDKTRREPWTFLAVEPWMKERGHGQDESQKKKQEEFNKLLDAGRELFFKIWKLDDGLSRRRARMMKWLTVLGVIGGALILAVLVALVFALLAYVGAGPKIVPGQAIAWIGVLSAVALLASALLCAVAAAFYFLKLRRVPQWVDAVAHSTVGGLLLVIGRPLAGHHMRRYEPLYLERGKLERLVGNAP